MSLVVLCPDCGFKLEVPGDHYDRALEAEVQRRIDGRRAWFVAPVVALGSRPW